MLQNSEAFSLVKNIVSRRSHSGTEVLSGVANCVDQVVEKTPVSAIQALSTLKKHSCHIEHIEETAIRSAPHTHPVAD